MSQAINYFAADSEPYYLPLADEIEIFRAAYSARLPVLLKGPTGCGKTRLLGEHQEPEVVRGSCTNLIDNGERIGAVLRTQTNVKPVFVSTGHKISLNSATEWVLKLTPKYRLPETTRLADQMVNRVLKEVGI